MSGLHIDSVLKSFDGRSILTDVYLSCQPGEIVGLFGRNGSGKSTLLKIIFSSLAAEQRYVSVDGQQVRNLRDGRGLLKYLPQDSFLPDHIRIGKVLDLFCSPAEAAAISTHPFIEPWLNKKAGMLSGGEKRLLEVTLVIHSHARYVLIDEPFNGIAPLYTEDIKEMIRAQAAAGKGFIVTDHNHRNIIDVATRMALIHDGAVRRIDHPEALTYWGYLPEGS